MVEFTKQMKKEYTILIPDMAEIHFKLLKNVMRNFGYKLTVLYNQGPQVVEEGLKYVHNDTCYPALLVIGQMLDALRSGEYDVNKTALMLMQTGGGCRASNYVPLLRKALEKAGYGFVPVISLNFNNIEKQSGFKITVPLLRRCMAALAYGDLLMLLNNQTKAYEIEKGESMRTLDYWIQELPNRFENKKGFKKSEMIAAFNEIVRSFAEIPMKKTAKIKVGIVGEIYIKYAALGNNNLEKFLYEQGCEVMVPGVMDFMLYCVRNNANDYGLYGGSRIKYEVARFCEDYLCEIKNRMIEAVEKSGVFAAPADFKHLAGLTRGIIGDGCKMGEGWLLTAEMVELIELGYENIICVQPFGCMPNHIVGKGMIRKIQQKNPNANIVAVDYDPGATKVNQENRIKLMLEVARERLREKEKFMGGREKTSRDIYAKV